MDLCEFKVRLVYRVSSRIAKDTQRNPVSKIIKNKRNRVFKICHVKMVNTQSIWILYVTIGFLQEGNREEKESKVQQIFAMD